MHTDSAREGRSSLKTATGIADPVLLRLATGQGVLVLLASDMTYAKAGIMRLQQVRWVRGRRAVRELFTTNRMPLTGAQPELQLRQMGGHWVGTLARQAIFRAPARNPGFAMTNLSRAQYQAHRAATPRRLMLAGNQLAPRPAHVAKALRAIHRARFAVKSVLTAKLA